jgi:hypothetical protein
VLSNNTNVRAERKPPNSGKASGTGAGNGSALVPRDPQRPIPTADERRAQTRS